MEKKRCSKCDKTKSLSEFNWKNKSKHIRHCQCRICTRKISKDHYENNRESYIERSWKFTKARRSKNQEKVLQYLEKHPCVDCGEKDPVVLQFDHIRGKKRNAVSNLSRCGYGWDTVKTEINKCEVRCANCHIRRHYKTQTGVPD